MKGLYIHIPFCVSKCSYCDFTSYTNRQDYYDKYTDAVVREIRDTESSEFTSIFIGGGTPTILSFNHLLKIVDAIHKYHKVDKNAEFTIEANPETVKNADILKLGVNRVSMGLQTHDDRLLKLISRCHSFDTFKKAYYTLREAGLNNMNIDIMYGLPTQTVDVFKETIDKVLEFSPEHVSAYELNLSDVCPMQRLIDKGQYSLPSENEVLEMTKALKNLQPTYNRYEISNYAKPGFECKHNLTYWHNGYYVGIGAAASGHIKENGEDVRYTNVTSLDGYINGEKGERLTVDVDEQMFETVMVGLRLIRGINLETFKNRFGVSLEEKLALYINEHQNLIKVDNGYMYLTDRGLDIQNTVLSDILGYFY